MDSIQMQYEFNNECRNHDILRGIDISTDDIEMYLNHSQILIIDKYIELYNINKDAKLYLNKLTKAARLGIGDSYTNSSTVENCRWFTLPSTLKSFVSELEEVSFTLNSTTYRSRVKEIEGDHYNLNKKNPFKKPYEDMVWKINHGATNTVSSDKIVQLILPENATLIYYYFYYVIYPTEMNIANNTTTELDSSIHNEIVIKAVDLFLQSCNNRISLDNKLK